MNPKDDALRASTRACSSVRKEQQITRAAIPKMLDVGAFLARQLTPGMFIHQRYQLIEEIGQGGMGQIWKAKDCKPRNLQSSYVAIKRVLIPAHYPDPNELIQRFQRECILLTTIQHPNLVTGIEYFEEAKDHFLVMEWIDGVSLESILKKQPKSFSFMEQVAIAYQMCRGFELLHSTGILHRDIKPSNILLMPQSGIVKILDLGLAKSLVQRIEKELRTMTRIGTVLGTAEYLSPEQVDGNCSPSSDMFSLGILLYQFFSWMPHSPFLAQSLIGTFDNIQKKELCPLQDAIKWACSNGEKKCYQSFGKILAQCLQKNPSQRLKDDRILLHELEVIYQNLQQLSSACQKQWKLKKVTSPVDPEKVTQFREQYAEDYSDDRSLTRRQNNYPHQTHVIRYFFIVVMGFILIFAAWDVFFGTLSPIPSDILEASTESTANIPAQPTEPASPVSNAPTSPTEPTANNIPAQSTEPAPSVPNTPTSPADHPQIAPDERQSSLPNEKQPHPPIGEKMPSSNLQKLYPHHIPSFSLVSTPTFLAANEEQLRQKQSDYLKIQKKIDSILSLQNQARQKSNTALITKYQKQLVELRYQADDLDLALMDMAKISQHTPESLVRYQELAQEAGYRIHKIYATRLFIQKFPNHSQTEAMKQELVSLEDNILHEIDSPGIPLLRKKLRTLLYNLGYLAVAQWNFEDIYVQKCIAEVNTLIAQSFPDLLPWWGVIRVLTYIHNGDYKQAQIELDKLQHRPLQFPISFLSLYKGTYLWPEIVYAEAVLAFAQNQQATAMNKFNWLKNNVAKYPLDKDNLLGDAAKFYDQFDRSQWQKKLRDDLATFVTVLTQRALKNLNQIMAQGKVNPNDLIAVYADLLFLEQEQNIIHYNLGMIFYQNQEYKLAEQHFIYAQKLNGRFYEPIFILGKLYLDTQQWDKAEQCFRFCTVFQPLWDKQMGPSSQKYLQQLENYKQKQK